VPFLCDPKISVALIDVADKGEHYVDILALDPAAPACSPDQCEFLGSMDASGRASLTLAASAPGDAFLFTIDGRQGFEGRYRLAVSCCGQELESFCSNLDDDDGDGLTDCDDQDCDNHPACSTAELVCDDGDDNEGDGLADCDDPDCESAANCHESICDDGLDSDGDDLTDCDDPDCDGTLACVTACTTYKTISCGEELSGESNVDGTDQFDGYGCDGSGGFCSFAYSAPEQTYLIEPTCAGEVKVKVKYKSGADVFYLNLLGHHCDVEAEFCGGLCQAPAAAAMGVSGDPAELTIDGEKGKAYWVNVEPDVLFGGVAVTYNIEVECSCL
jgi:hypothetical protein